MTSAQLIALAAAIVVPWITGTVLLLWLESSGRSAREISWPRLLGYGYFLGMLVCATLLQIAFLVESLPPQVATGVALLLICLGGLWLSFRAARHRSGANSSSLDQDRRKKSGLLTVLLLAAILVHLAPILMEVLERPVFGWDAWTTWMYRSKLWFLRADLAPFVDPLDWLGSAADNIYTLDAWQYPKFVSLVNLWTALNLGQWIEPLINLPSYIAGVAIAMALYGQAREYGMGRVASLIMLYLFFSVPLMNAHMALSGYADIWMAGFAGLGFVAVIRWMLDRNPNQAVVGLLFLFVSLFVKREGLVWALAALVFIAVGRHPARSVLAGSAVIAIFSVVALGLDLTYLEMPGLGGIGYAEGQILLGHLGRYRVAFHNVLGSFLTSFFVYGNWNLLWFFVILSLTIAMARFRVFENRIVLIFLLVFFVQLFAMFFLTSEGKWAEDYTAINRLPLQLLPAIIFACMIIWHSAVARQPIDTATAK